MIKISIIIFLIFGKEHLNAQEYLAKTLNTENGLPSDQIYYTIQDSKGYIWIGTKNGVVRWDSKNLNYFTINEGLPNNEIIGIYEDKMGRIWFFSFSNELSYYYNQKIYNSKLDPRLKTIKKGVSYGLVMDGDNIFYTDINGHMHCMNVYTLKEQQNLIDTVSFFLVYKDGKKKIRSDISNYTSRLAGPIARNGVLNVIKSIVHQGFSIKSPCTSSKDSLGMIALKYIDSVYRLGYRASSLFQNKNFMVREHKDKLLYHDNELKLIFNHSVISKKLKKSILKLYLNHNRLHFIEDSKTLYSYDPLIKKKELKFSSSFYNISKSNKNNYLAQYQHIYKLNENGMIETEYTENLSEFKYVYYHPLFNALYLGTSNGLYCTKNNHLQQINKKRTYCVFVDSKDRLWYSTIENLYLADQYYPTILLEKALILNPNFKVFVYDIKEDKLGRILIASNNGVYIYDTDLKKKYWLNDKNILSSNECNLLEIDPKDNSIWVSSFEGLNHFKIVEKNGKLEFILINRFFKDDGLYSNEIKDIQFYGDSLWIATSKGLNLLHDKQFRPALQKIPIHINKLWINGFERPVNSKLELSNQENNISIDYSAIYFERRDRLIVRYKLIRNAKLIDERQLTDNRLNLLALENGNYILELYAFDADYPYIKSEKKKLVFTIKPPFYKTWWFWTFTIFSSLILLGLYLYIRLVRKKNRLIQEAETQSKLTEYSLKSLQNQMNPHFIFNSLNTIQRYILTKKEDEATTYLENFSKLIREMLENSKMNTISLEEEIIFNKRYVDLELMRYQNKFEVNFDIELDEDLSEIFIPNMLIQPLIENAIKHGVANLTARKGRIDLRFSMFDEDLLKVQVIDNGKVLNTSNKNSHSSSAIKIIEQRLDLYTKNQKKGFFNLNFTDNCTIAILVIPI